MHGTVVEIIQIRLGMRKICARQVPKLLDDEHKQNQVAAGLDFKYYHHAKGEGAAWSDGHWKREMGPSFHTRDEECIEVVGTEMWRLFSENELRKIEQQSLPYGILEEYSSKGVTTMEETYFDTRRSDLVNCHEVWSCCTATLDLTRLNLSHFFLNSFY